MVVWDILASGFKLSDLLPIVIFIGAGLFGVLNKYIEKKQLEAKENAKLGRRGGDADLFDDEPAPAVEIQQQQPPARPVKPIRMSARPLSKPAVAKVVQSPPKIQAQVQSQRFSSTVQSPPITKPQPAASPKKTASTEQRTAGRITENVIFAILKKPDNLRAAFILSDVLGKPTALKEEE